VRPTPPPAPVAVQPPPAEPQLPPEPEVIALPSAPVPLQEALSEAKDEYDEAVQALRDGDTQRAESMLLAMTEEYPEFAGPHVNLGIMYLEAGQLEEAEAAFDDALEINPNQAASYNHLGIIYRQQGRFEEALAAYQKALELDPGYANAHLNLAIMLDLYQGQPAQALEHYQQYQQLAVAPDERIAKWILDVQRRAAAGNQ
jgi:tetratricopeptide (TPR) repeat protein